MDCLVLKSVILNENPYIVHTFIVNIYLSLHFSFYLIPFCVREKGGVSIFSIQGVCACTKIEYVKFTELKACTVGIYSTYESLYLFSLGEYICLLLIVYLKICLIYIVVYYLYICQHYNCQIFMQRI